MMTRGMRGRASATAAIALLAVAGVAATGAFAGKGLKTSKSSTSIGPIPDSGTAAATCKNRTKAVSGGWSSTLDIEATSAIVPFESRRVAKRFWTASAFNNYNVGTPFTSYAYCAKQQVKSKTAEVTAPASTGTPTPVTATANCKKGTKIVSGGFDADLDLAGPATVIPIAESRRVSRRRWAVEGANLYDSAGTLTAQASCRKGKAPKERTVSHDFGTTFEVAELEASCKKPEWVVAGGFSFDRRIFTDEASLFLGTFRKRGKRSWVAEAAGETASGAATLTISAYCEKKKG